MEVGILLSDSTDTTLLVRDIGFRRGVDLALTAAAVASASLAVSSGVLPVNLRTYNAIH